MSPSLRTLDNRENWLALRLRRLDHPKRLRSYSIDVNLEVDLQGVPYAMGKIWEGGAGIGWEEG